METGSNVAYWLRDSDHDLFCSSKSAKLPECLRLSLSVGLDVMNPDAALAENQNYDRVDCADCYPADRSHFDGSTSFAVDFVGPCELRFCG